jgi:hypothetical protein
MPQDSSINLEVASKSSSHSSEDSSRKSIFPDSSLQESHLKL